VATDEPFRVFADFRGGISPFFNLDFISENIIMRSSNNVSFLDFHFTIMLYSTIVSGAAVFVRA
jgi:hypothetical protein